jgi:hypothetical protein
MTNACFNAGPTVPGVSSRVEMQAAWWFRNLARNLDWF